MVCIDKTIIEEHAPCHIVHIVPMIVALSRDPSRDPSPSSRHLILP